MSDDQPTETRSRSGRRSIAVVLGVLAVGAIVFWFWQTPGDHVVVTPQRVDQAQIPIRPIQSEASENTRQLNALQQAVKDLQASQQKLDDQFNELKRQLSAEEGDRKMLSQQVGALTGRVDSLASTSAAGATGTVGNITAKRKR
jgi:uncharacterized protein HemX